MKTAQEVMTKDVATIHPHVTVAEAIQRMRDRQVGSLLVEQLSPSDTWGIITQTDVVQKVVAPGKEPAQVKVAEVMTKPITAVQSDTSLQECARLMARDHIRRVFVFDGQDVIGVVSASDIFQIL
ncbi:MAG: CBS domain-containing protein [Anaerolineales bacterium]|nr:MAG: CBS domain-containing protein [Anaerolineales bacterium]